MRVVPRRTVVGDIDRRFNNLSGSHHQSHVIVVIATARMKWNKEVNKVVMECFYRSKPFDEEGKPIRGYRQLRRY